jgi:rhodanese-related sulfurtransferase
VYCRTGRRSGVALSILKDNGFTDVINLETLDNAANKTGLPVVAN